MSLVLVFVRKKEVQKVINESCGERGSNTRPSDLQSDALPTELSPLNGKQCVILTEMINEFAAWQLGREIDCVKERTLVC